MSVNISSVSSGAAAAPALSLKPDSSVSTASTEASVQVNLPKPVNVQVTPPKTVDMSAQIAAHQEALQKALDELNQQASQSKMSVGFSLDKASGMQYVQVTNAQSGDVVMQFPSNKMLEIAASIEQLKGMLYNKKV
jgi:flagellar protein FlaG